MSCFVCGKPAKGADYEDSMSRSNSVSSFGASRTSTMSSSTHSQLRYSHSYSRYGTRKETIREETTVFSMAEIYKATRNFSRENIIGQGGFGTVYKGKLKDGSLVAVKRAKKNLYNQLSAEFKCEAHTLSKVEHLNLVRFLGWLENDDEQIILLEYVGNGTQYGVSTMQAIKKAKEEGVVLVMDPRLRRNPAAMAATESMMVLAAECLAPTRRSRPPMKKCAETLWRIRKEFREMQFSSSNANNEGPVLVPIKTTAPSAFSGKGLRPGLGLLQLLRAASHLLLKAVPELN